MSRGLLFYQTQCGSICRNFSMLSHLIFGLNFFVFWCCKIDGLSVVLTFNILTFSFSVFLIPGRGGKSPPQSVPGSPRGVIDQLRTDAFDELSGIGSWGSQRFAGSVRSEASGRRLLPVVASHSVDVGPRRFHHKKVATQEALTFSCEYLEMDVWKVYRNRHHV